MMSFNVNAYLLTINNSGGDFNFNDGIYNNTVVKKSTGELQLKWIIDSWSAYYTYDKSLGNLAYDEANNNHCVIFGANWTQSKYNKGLNLDGLNDYLYCGVDRSLNITKALSMGLDIKLNKYSANPNIIHKYIMNIGYMLGLGTNNGKISSYIRSGGSYTTTSSYIPVGTWKHIFITWNYSGDNKIRTYVDGILKETSSAILPLSYTPNIPLKISGTLGGFSYLNATIDNLGIYNYALNSTEVYSVYKNEHENIGYWEIENACLFNDMIKNISFILNQDIYTRIDFYLGDILIQSDIKNNTWYNATDKGDNIILKLHTVNKSLTPTSKTITYNCHTVTTTTILPEGLINVKVLDMTDSGYDEILIYQNDNISTKYIMKRNLSNPFKICQNVNYSFIITPKSVSIIRNMDNYFLDYLLGNIYLLAIILALISILGYLIFTRRR